MSDYYKKIGGLFIPDANGRVFVMKNYATPVNKIRLSYAEMDFTAWLLPNDYATTISLKPFVTKKYRFAVDRFIAHHQGRVTIKGIFPFYYTDEIPSRAVWIDVDRAFSINPISLETFIERIMTMGRYKPKIEQKKIGRPKKYRVVVEQIPFGGNQAYKWTCLTHGKPMIVAGCGYEGTRVTAERAAYAFGDRLGMKRSQASTVTRWPLTMRKISDRRQT